jgi:CheY-like chemotaxis protein
MAKKVVIVEDDLIILELHKHYVENLGQNVVGCFSSGEEAIDFFRSNSADLILMDIRLESSLDGIETMKEIQKLHPVPVVYITGNTEEVNLKRALNTGMKGFYSKPIGPDDLEEIIDSISSLNDSILYAERIQKAIFPQRPEIHRMFADSLYINRPKNVISGDFSFLVPKKRTNTVIGGVGDCTGHGIPAALLSVLCHEIVSSNSKKYDDLRKIIYKLNDSIRRNLARLDKTNTVSDGLDLIIFKIKPDENSIEIAGIKRPFIHYKSNEGIHEYVSLKGKMIGQEYEDESDIPFHKITYSPNDYFYFFSDGITDQFGGPEFKKIMKKRIIEFFDRTIDMPAEIKEIELDLMLRKWQGNNDQTDDMLFMGICPSKVNTKYIHYKNQ